MCMHVLACVCVLQADAEEMQPQRLASSDWAAQDHSLFHSTRGVRQPHDPLVQLVTTVADQLGGDAEVGCLSKIEWHKFNYVHAHTHTHVRTHAHTHTHTQRTHAHTHESTHTHTRANTHVTMFLLYIG